MTPSLFSVKTYAATDSYTLSLHDALPICESAGRGLCTVHDRPIHPHRVVHVAGGLPPHLVELAHLRRPPSGHAGGKRSARSEEHTSELQSLTNLVCRLLLEKKNSV